MLTASRSLGWYSSTVGRNWNWQERLFLLSGNSAKATVQAAIEAIPLAQEVDGGEVLARSVLSILGIAKAVLETSPFPVLVVEADSNPRTIHQLDLERLPC